MSDQQTVSVKEQGEAYKTGAKAFHDGHLRTDNPHDRHGTLWVQWNSGWTTEDAMAVVKARRAKRAKR